MLSNIQPYSEIWPCPGPEIIPAGQNKKCALGPVHKDASSKNEHFFEEKDKRHLDIKGVYSKQRDIEDR